MLVLPVLIAGLISSPSAFAGQPSSAEVAATCSDTSAKILNPVAPVYPKSAQPLAHNIHIVLTVRVSATGKVTGTSVSKSSGRPEFDHAAIVAASKSTYKAATHNCRPVAGTYTYFADFMPE
jgi:TonB family protein